LTEEKGSLVGVVEPAESGARVSAWQAKEIAFTYIDSAGYFMITDLPVGTYRIKVEAEGYTTCESKPGYIVYAGGTTTVGTITLRPFPDLIRSVYPPDKAIDVSVYTNILIYFNEPMNKESVMVAFSIDPVTEGTFYWRDRADYYGREQEFRPANNLSPNMLYTVTLDTAVQDTAGNRLSEPFCFSFTTIGVGVESFYPAEGQTDVNTDTYISIYFNTEMNRSSVENAFSIDPSVTGTFDWHGDARKGYAGLADRLWFRPKSYLRSNTSYTVTLDSTAQDENGIGISEPLSFSFTTEELKVKAASPEDGSAGIRTSIRISILFNTEMSKSATEEAFSILPSVNGDFYWNDNLTSFSLQPKSGYLAANTTYQVKIDTTALDPYGGHLSQSYQFSFTTEGIELISLPYDNSLGVTTSTSIRISFNTAMDQTSVMNAFSITPDVEGSFVWSMLRQFTFDPDQVLGSNTVYTVNIDTSAQDMYGTNLGQGYSFSFTTDEIRIIQTHPQNGATYVDPDASIEIYFNTDMDQASVVEAFWMVDSDSIEIEGLLTWSELNRFIFNPDLFLAPDEEYTVTISTDAVDIRGVNMPKEFVLWFKTRP
jgi:hypothetical protein